MPHEKHPFFGTDTHTRYPKRVLLAFLMQRYVRLVQHTKNIYFTAFCISNTPILGMQRHFVGISDLEVCAFGPPHQRRTFLHCAFQTHPYSVSKEIFGGISGTEICVFHAPHQKHILYGSVHFTHTHTSHAKTLLLAFLVQRYVCSARHTKRVHFWALCI